jgi:ABC-type lipoprotein release transport system permease subunit
MNTEVLDALLSLVGTLLGTLAGILASSKLTSYRLEQLEKKMDALNTSAAAIPTIQADIKRLTQRVEHLEKYHQEKT